ncbi:MAG: MBL fold metallo-hydrolase [Gemmatimonadota bacterium]
MAPSGAAWQRLAADLYLYRDTCNVYLLRCAERALCVDFGTGAWVPRLGEIGVRHLDHVVLTHAHRDQCCGLYRGTVPWPAAVVPAVHVPAGDAALLEPAGLERFWAGYQSNGCPPNYAAPRLPVPGALPDLAADTERVLGPARFCAIPTPGHTPGALSYAVAWGGRQVVFCGDAVRAGGRLHQPYHLEWDHWTPGGALAAWYGLERLGACRMDLLLPAHGPVLRTRARQCVRRAQDRLTAFIRAKGSVCPDEPARWLDTEATPSGAGRLSPHLYAFGGNGFLLLSDGGDGFVVDPTLPDMPALEALCGELGLKRLSAATASHYHLDHSDGLDYLRRTRGTRSWLHPQVAEPLVDRDRFDVPWLPPVSVPVDRYLPREGRCRWREYTFQSRALAGQTHWHGALATEVDGARILFSGDNFQPPTRWNGTGGFCAYNGSRFVEGFARSAAAVRELAPDVICNGHRCIYRYAASHYRRIEAWAGRAERAVRDLCPSAPWLADYDCRTRRWEPFVSRVRPGQTVRLALVCTNHGRAAVAVRARAVTPEGWAAGPGMRAARTGPARSRRLVFTIQVPRGAPPGRHLLAADVETDGDLAAEACVALVDVA